MQVAAWHFLSQGSSICSLETASQVVNEAQFGAGGVREMGRSEKHKYMDGYCIFIQCLWVSWKGTDFLVRVSIGSELEKPKPDGCRSGHISMENTPNTSDFSTSR